MRRINVLIVFCCFISSIAVAQTPQHLKVFGISMGETRGNFEKKAKESGCLLCGSECNFWINPYDIKEKVKSDSDLVWHVEVSTPTIFLGHQYHYVIREALISKYGAPSNYYHNGVSSTTYNDYYEWYTNLGHITFEFICEKSDCHAVLDFFDKDNVKKVFGAEIKNL